MKRIGMVTGLLLAGAMVLGAAGTAQAAAYIKFDGIDGEATDKDHKGWIDVLSATAHSHARPATATLKAVRAEPADSSAPDSTRPKRAALAPRMKAAEGKHIDEPVLVLRKAGGDRASRQLRRAMRQNRTIPEATLHVTEKPGSAPYLIITMTDVLVSSYDVVAGGSAGGPAPTEEISLNYEEIRIHYTPRQTGKQTGKQAGKDQYQLSDGGDVEAHQEVQFKIQIGTSD